MKPQSEAELLREKRKQIWQLQKKLAAKRGVLERRKEECVRIQDQMHARKVQIEDIKTRIRSQSKKKTRLSDSYSRHRQEYEKRLA